MSPPPSRTTTTPTATTTNGTELLTRARHGHGNMTCFFLLLFFPLQVKIFFYIHVTFNRLRLGSFNRGFTTAANIVIGEEESSPSARGARATRRGLFVFVPEPRAAARTGGPPRVITHSDIAPLVVTRRHRREGAGTRSVLPPLFPLRSTFPSKQSVPMHP